jgi:hypothetical protein
MQSPRQTSPYEVLCHHCNVTFPLGTRHCIHCGGPIGRGRGLFAAAAAAANAPSTSEPVEIEDEEELSRRSSFSPVSILWLVLIAGGAIFRACAEG